MAATDDPAVNERVGGGRGGPAGLLRARRRRRGRHGVHPGGRQPRRRHRRGDGQLRGRPRPASAASLRDAIVTALRDGALTATAPPASAVPGVVLVGGGPGDPELISVAGRKALMEADVVVADRLAPRASCSASCRRTPRSSTSPSCRAAARRSRRRSTGSSSTRALAGKRVVRFKGGDNFVFGRGYEEVLACREAGVPVPGGARHQQPARRAGGGRHPGHAPRGHPRLHGRLRPPAARTPRVAGPVGRRWPGSAARIVLMMAVENAPRDRRGAAARRPRPARPRSRSSATAPCPPSARCSPRSRDLAEDDRARGRSSRPAIIVVGDVVAVAHPERTRPLPSRARRGWRRYVEIDDPADPRLADYRDLRDVALRQSLEAEHGLFLAEGEKVVRRAVEAGYRRALLPDGPALARRAGRRARRRSDAPCYVVSEALAEQVTGFHVHRGALASLRADARCPRWTRCSRARARSSSGGHRRPHQRRGRASARAAALGVDAVLLSPAVRRPALPARGQGRDGRGVRAAVDPAARTGTTRCRTLSRPAGSPRSP